MGLDRREIIRCLVESPVYRNLSRHEQHALVEEVLLRYASLTYQRAVSAIHRDIMVCEPETR